MGLTVALPSIKMIVPAERRKEIPSMFMEYMQKLFKELSRMKEKK